MDSNRDIEEPIQLLVLSAGELLTQSDLLGQVVALVNSAYREHNWLFPNQERFDADEQFVSELEGMGRCAVILDPDPIATVCAKPCYAIHEEIKSGVDSSFSLSV